MSDTPCSMLCVCLFARDIYPLHMFNRNRPVGVRCRCWQEKRALSHKVKAAPSLPCRCGNTFPASCMGTSAARIVFFVSSHCLCNVPEFGASCERVFALLKNLLRADECRCEHKGFAVSTQLLRLHLPVKCEQRILNSVLLERYRCRNTALTALTAAVNMKMGVVAAETHA